MNPAPSLKDLRHAPKLILSVIWQLIYYTFVEVEMLLLATLSIVIGWRLGWEWGLITYLSIYLIWRMLGNYVGTLSASIRASSQPVMGRKEESHE